MDIGLVGEGPALDAAAAALADVDVNAAEVGPELPAGFDRAVVAGVAGADAFGAVDDRLDRWVAVEVGGLGGHALADVDAAVTLFADACYDCLRARVAANDPETVAEPTGVRSAVRYAGAVAARRLIRDLAGEDLGDTVFVESEPERSFLPIPGCGCDGGRETTLRLDHREVGLEDALDRAELAVDDRVGVVREVGERESFPIPYYVAATADTSGFSDARAAEFAAGADTDWNAAFMKSLGEALERYCAGVYRESAFARATADELREMAGVADEPAAVPGDLNRGTGDGAVVVAPGRFVAPDGDQFAPGPEAGRPWVRGTELASGRPAFLPAEVVHYPPVERRIRPAITTGLGLGNSPVEAVLSGLYEVIERDAAMLGWYSTFEPLAVTFDGELEDLRKRARAESLDSSVVLLTADVDVPVVAAAVRRDGAWPRFAAGSGASLDPAAAARSALAEALQNWTELRAMGPDRADDEGGAIGRYADDPADAAAFFDPQASASAGSLGASDRTGEAELAAVLERLDDADLGAYAARITTRDVDALGFEAVRVVVPEAQPLFTGDPYFGERAREVPRSMGFDPRLDGSYHPFP